MRLLFFAFASLTSIIANAQWNADPSLNNAVCNFSGSQTNVQITSDGAGGTICTWADSRNGSQDIYAQRLDANGNLQWAVDGVPICIAAFNQLNPKLVSDGSGGAIITWIDDRNGAGAGNYDIYAQRINSTGAVQWVADGAVITTATGIQNAQQLIADGSGGAIIVWSDGKFSGSSNADIFAQRINSAGSVQWTADGEAVCTASSLQNIPQLVSDGAGGAIIAWEDWRNFGQSDIYAQRISNGVASWTFNGVVICYEPNFAHQYNTKMIADGSGGAIMCWEDKRNSGSNTDLYTQRVNNSGVVQWINNGIAICTATGIQFSHQLITDASGGAIFAWEDRRTGRDIYAQRINTSGAAQWAANGIAVCNTVDIQEEPQLVARASGGAIFIWTDSRNSLQQDIYAQGIDATANILWAANGVPVANETHAQFTARLITDGADGAIIAWQDLRTTLDYDIYSSRLFSSGTLPLHLISFWAVNNKNDVVLTWDTENEINSSHFDIEFSGNGISFTKLATVKAKNTSVTNRYSFTHVSPQDNVLYYRLKLVDADAKFNYSETVKVTMNKLPQLALYPNPAGNFIQLKNIKAADVKEIQLISIDGKIVMAFKTNNSMQYNISDLTSGVYLLKLVKTDDTAPAIQFIKQ